jgi:hypothetical protein
MNERSVEQNERDVMLKEKEAQLKKIKLNKREE